MHHLPSGPQQQHVPPGVCPDLHSDVVVDNAFWLQLYVTDDDIVQTSASISQAFALMQQYGLLLAQPSLCSPFESATWQNPLYKDARLVLQYTTFVEIMVPMFNMNFFTSKVIATLEHAETGMSCIT